VALREEIEKQGNWLFRWRSYLPLLVVPLLLLAMRRPGYAERLLGDAAGDLYEILCVCISFVGLAIRCLAVGYAGGGTSGRNTKEQVADSLNVSGMYSTTRHPLYLGNFIIILGIALFVQVWWFVLATITAFFMYYERIMFAEEEYLRRKFGDDYLAWANATPAFWPDARRWRRPAKRFSFRTVLKREYSGLFTIVVSFTLLEVIEGIRDEGALELDAGWRIFFAVGLICYVTLRTLKKKTRLLRARDS
jgi:protein-S-isoprenylcysteine O-methyltransferase Ste14